MTEQPKALEILPSYLIDLVYFLELLVGPPSVLTTTEEEKCLHYFEDCLSDYAKEEIKRIQKVLPKNKTVSELVLPLILADTDFENFQMTELLEGNRYLISLYKKSPDYVKATKDYKKFIAKDAQELMGALMMIVAELERVHFKRCWLEKRLPQINDQIRAYEQGKDVLTLIEKVNEEFDSPLLSYQRVYLLSFNVNSSVVKVGDVVLGSPRLNQSEFIHSLLECWLAPIALEPFIKPLVRRLKKNKELIKQYKLVKPWHRTLEGYLAFSLKIAFSAYLAEKFGALEEPLVYLKGKNQRALHYYDWMTLYPKERAQKLEDYLVSSLLAIELPEEKRG